MGGAPVTADHPPIGGDDVPGGAGVDGGHARIDGAGAVPAGWALVRGTVLATALFSVLAVLSALFHFRDDRNPPDDSILALANIVISLGLFAAGCVMFVVGFLRAIGRSRTSQIEFSGLFFLVGPVAPQRVRRPLWGAYAVQLVVAVATAAARPLTDQAFVILAPMCGQGAMALWGGTHGRFADRDDDGGGDGRGDGREEDRPPAPQDAG